MKCGASRSQIPQRVSNWVHTFTGYKNANETVPIIHVLRLGGNPHIYQKEQSRSHSAGASP
jgi:hypothetical protein